MYIIKVCTCVDGGTPQITCKQMEISNPSPRMDFKAFVRQIWTD